MVPFNQEHVTGRQGVITGFFGKLPSHGDFVRWNVFGAAVTTVEQWFEQGFRAVAANGGSAVLGSCEATCFLMSPRETGESVIGLLRAGMDRTGREYPFVIFRVIPGQGSGYVPSEIIGSQLGFLSALRGIALTPTDALEAGVVRRGLDAVPLGERPVRGNWRADLGGRPVSDINGVLAALCANNGGHALHRDLLQRVELLRDSASVRRRGGLQLPATGVAADAAALFWARAIETVCGEERCPPLTLTWPSWPASPDERAEIAAFVGLPPTAFMKYLVGAGAHTDIAPLTSLATLESEAVQMRGECVGAIGSPATLTGLLDRLDNARSLS